MPKSDDVEFLVLLTAITLIRVIAAHWKYRYMDKQPYHTDSTNGSKYTSDVVNSPNWNRMADRCEFLLMDRCRMMPEVFVLLCKELRDRGLLRDSRKKVTVERQVLQFMRFTCLESYCARLF